MPSSKAADKIFCILKVCIHMTFPLQLLLLQGPGHSHIRRVAGMTVAIHFFYMICTGHTVDLVNMFCMGACNVDNIMGNSIWNTNLQYTI